MKLKRYKAIYHNINKDQIEYLLPATLVSKKKIEVIGHDCPEEFEVRYNKPKGIITLSKKPEKDYDEGLTLFVRELNK